MLPLKPIAVVQPLGGNGRGQAIGGAPSQSQPATAIRLAASATRPRACRQASLASPSMRQIASAARRIDARALLHR